MKVVVLSGQACFRGSFLIDQSKLLFPVRSVLANETKYARFFLIMR